MRKVMVFGTFDGIHEGHRAFFREAKKHGEHLVAVVAPDHIVHHLKGRLPDWPEGDRMEHMHREPHVDSVVLGDPEIGTWQVVRNHRPHVVALGYDQDEMAADLENNITLFPWPLEIVRMPAHEPEKYHSRLLRRK